MDSFLLRHRKQTQFSHELLTRPVPMQFNSCQWRSPFTASYKLYVAFERWSCEPFIGIFSSGWNVHIKYIIIPTYLFQDNEKKKNHHQKKITFIVWLLVSDQSQCSSLFECGQSSYSDWISWFPIVVLSSYWYWPIWLSSVNHLPGDEESYCLNVFHEHLSSRSKLLKVCVQQIKLKENSRKRKKIYIRLNMYAEAVTEYVYLGTT